MPAAQHLCKRMNLCAFSMHGKVQACAGGLGGGGGGGTCVTLTLPEVTPCRRSVVTDCRAEMAFGDRGASPVPFSCCHTDSSLGESAAVPGPPPSAGD